MTRDYELQLPQNYQMQSYAQGSEVQGIDSWLDLTNELTAVQNSVRMQTSNWEVRSLKIRDLIDRKMGYQIQFEAVSGEGIRLMFNRFYLFGDIKEERILLTSNGSEVQVYHDTVSRNGGLVSQDPNRLESILSESQKLLKERNSL